MSGRPMLARRTAVRVLAAAAGLLPRASRAQVLTPLTVALVPVENAAQAYYPQELGYFTRAGFNVELQPLSNGGAIASAVSSGAADIGFATVIPIAIAHTKGLPLVFIAAGYASNDRRPTSALLVPTGSTIARAADLNGKLLATNGLATINEYVPRAWVDAGGGDASTLRFAELPFSEMGSALASGRVDAAYVAEPYATVAKPLTRVLFYGTAVTKDGEILGGWFATQSWARSRSDAVRRFAGAMRQAAAWANANPARSAQIMVKYLKIDPRLASAVNRTTFAEQLAAARMQQSIDLAARYARFRAFPAAELVFSPG